MKFKKYFSYKIEAKHSPVQVDEAPLMSFSGMSEQVEIPRTSDHNVEELLANVWNDRIKKNKNNNNDGMGKRLFK